MNAARDKEPSDTRRLDGQLLSDLWVFRYAARLGSLTAAAERLHVTQGAVSQRVLRLEARLGVQLFLRENGRISLTHEGEAMADAMTQVALVLNDRLSRIEPIHRTALVVSCVPSLATEWLVPHLQDFYERHPGIEIFVRAEMAPATPERCDDEGIDLVIDYRAAAPGDLHQLAELRELVFPVCSPRYRESLDDPEASAPVLLNDAVACAGQPADHEWNGWRRSAGVEWPRRAASIRHFNLAHLAYHAAMHEQGVAMGRSVLVQRLLAKGELVAALDVAPVHGAVYRLLANRPGNANSAMRRFAAWCSQAMAETQAAALSLLTARDTR